MYFFKYLLAKLIGEKEIGDFIPACVNTRAVYERIIRKGPMELLPLTYCNQTWRKVVIAISKALRSQ